MHDLYRYRVVKLADGRRILEGFKGSATGPFWRTSVIKEITQGIATTASGQNYRLIDQDINDDTESVVSHYIDKSDYSDVQSVQTKTPSHIRRPRNSQSISHVIPDEISSIGCEVRAHESTPIARSAKKVPSAAAQAYTPQGSPLVAQSPSVQKAYLEEIENYFEGIKWVNQSQRRLEQLFDQVHSSNTSLSTRTDTQEELLDQTQKLSVESWLNEHGGDGTTTSGPHPEQTNDAPIPHQEARAQREDGWRRRKPVTTRVESSVVAPSWESESPTNKQRQLVAYSTDEDSADVFKKPKANTGQVHKPTKLRQQQRIKTSTRPRSDHSTKSVDKRREVCADTLFSFSTSGSSFNHDPSDTRKPANSKRKRKVQQMASKHQAESVVDPNRVVWSAEEENRWHAALIDINSRDFYSDTDFWIAVSKAIKTKSWRQCADRFQESKREKTRQERNNRVALRRSNSADRMPPGNNTGHKKKNSTGSRRAKAANQISSNAAHGKQERNTNRREISSEPVRGQYESKPGTSSPMADYAEDSDYEGDEENRRSSKVNSKSQRSRVAVIVSSDEDKPVVSKQRLSSSGRSKAKQNGIDMDGSYGGEYVSSRARRSAHGVEEEEVVYQRQQRHNKSVTPRSQKIKIISDESPELGDPHERHTDRNLNTPSRPERVDSQVRQLSNRQSRQHVPMREERRRRSVEEDVLNHMSFGSAFKHQEDHEGRRANGVPSQGYRHIRRESHRQSGSGDGVWRGKDRDVYSPPHAVKKRSDVYGDEETEVPVTSYSKKEGNVRRMSSPDLPLVDGQVKLAGKRTFKRQEQLAGLVSRINEGYSPGVFDDGLSPLTSNTKKYKLPPMEMTPLNIKHKGSIPDSERRRLLSGSKPRRSVEDSQQSQRKARMETHKFLKTQKMNDVWPVRSVDSDRDMLTAAIKNIDSSKLREVMFKHLSRSADRDEIVDDASDRSRSLSTSPELSRQLDYYSDNE